MDPNPEFCAVGDTIRIIGEKERAARTASEFSLSAPGGGEGWGEVGEAAAPNLTHPLAEAMGPLPARRAERAKDRSLRVR
jgi:hypothetical protein